MDVFFMPGRSPPPPALCSGLNLAWDDAGRLSPTRPALIPCFLAPLLPCSLSLPLSPSLPVPCCVGVSFSHSVGLHYPSFSGCCSAFSLLVPFVCFGWFFGGGGGKGRGSRVEPARVCACRWTAALSSCAPGALLAWGALGPDPGDNAVSHPF